MTNFDNGFIADGAKLYTPTNYKVKVDITNAAPLQVTGTATATTVNATTGNITTVAATTVNATTGNITTVAATTVNGTNGNITTINSTTGNITNCITTKTNATNMNVATLLTTAAATVTNAVNAGSAAITGACNVGTVKVGASGDVINSILTYTSAAINVAAINVAATVYQELSLTVTGTLTTDTILEVKMDQASQAAENIYVIGAYVSAANTVKAQLYAAANTNALTSKTFAVTVKR